MDNKLKDFINDHRQAFDDEMPPANAWKNIQKEIDPGHKKPGVVFRAAYKWVAAAAICIIFSFVFLLTKKTGLSDNNTPDGKMAIQANDTSLIGPEYAAEASHIYAVIEKQQEQLRTLAAVEPQLYQQFSEDLSTLDSSYRVLKDRAILAPGREMIIRAMMQNLQMQAELLSKQLLIIQEYNHNKTVNNEKKNYRPAQYAIPVEHYNGTGPEGKREI